MTRKDILIVALSSFHLLINTKILVTYISEIISSFQMHFKSAKYVFKSTGWRNFICTLYFLFWVAKIISTPFSKPLCYTQLRKKKISLRIESANIRHQMQNYQFSKRPGFEMPPFISPPHNKINNFVTRADECTSFWYCLLFIDGSSWGYFFSLLEKKLLVRKFVDSNRSLTVKKKNNRTKKTKKRKKEPREILQEKRENI